MAIVSRSSVPERRTRPTPSGQKPELGERQQAEPGEHQRTGLRRGQTSPTAALVAVAAIGIGLSLHATVLSGVSPVADRNVAEPTLERVHDAVVTAGVATPERLEGATAAGPDGYQLRVSLRVDGVRWTAGPTPPSGIEPGQQESQTETAARRVAVRTGPGRVTAGSLRVEVWR